MRKILGKAALLLALSSLAFSPAHATSAYQMNGQGSIQIFGGGLPACLGDQGNCGSVSHDFTWGDLTVQGAGVLQGANVADQYSCASGGTAPSGASYKSGIWGNTSNFQLTFNFVCTRQNVTGVGPKYVVGWFSNVVASGPSGPQYHNVSSHAFNAGEIRPGAFAFAGYFRATDSTSQTSPYAVSNSTGDPMACGGGFAPTNNVIGDGLVITDAAFVGSCQAIA